MAKFSESDVARLSNFRHFILDYRGPLIAVHNTKTFFYERIDQVNPPVELSDVEHKKWLVTALTRFPATKGLGSVITPPTKDEHSAWNTLTEAEKAKKVPPGQALFTYIH